MSNEHDSGIQDIDQSCTIPAGHFVHHADFDCAEPYVMCAHKDSVTENKKVLVPTAMAYFLKTHFCGSNEMRELIIKAGRREVQNQIKEALGFED